MGDTEKLAEGIGEVTVNTQEIIGDSEKVRGDTEESCGVMGDTNEVTGDTESDEVIAELGKWMC